MSQNTEMKVKSRVYGNGRGWCFSSRDFSDFGEASAVRKALSRLVKQGIIRRIARGLYDYPKKHRIIGELAPDIQQAAQAIARKHSLTIQPSGSYAANLMGLTEQVPAKVVYLTDGRSKTVLVGNNEIFFKMTAQRFMELAGTRAGLFVQALKHIGETHVNDDVFLKAWQQLDQASKDLLIRKKSMAPLWLQAYISKFAQEEHDGAVC